MVFVKSERNGEHFSFIAEGSWCGAILVLKGI